MKYTLYWAAVFIGIITVLYVYHVSLQQTTENFQSSTSSITDIPINEVADPALDFPNKFVGYTNEVDNNIYTYLSCYTSNVARAGTNIQVYDPMINKWNSLVRTNDFTFSTSAGFGLPESFNLGGGKKGISMNGIQLTGPSSQTLALPNSGNILPSFSVAIYAQFNDINIPEVDGDIDMFTAHGQTPNAIQWRVKYNTNTCNITNEIIMGDYTKNGNKIVHSNISKVAFMTEGQNTLYSMAYDKTTDSVSLFIGRSEQPKQILEIKDDIILGPSSITINSTRNMKATIRNIAIFQDKVLTLSDVTKLDQYFSGLHGGLAQALASLSIAQNRITETNNLYVNQVSTTNQLIQSLSNQLKSCTVSPQTVSSPIPPVPISYPQWHISLADASNVQYSAADYQKCSFLNIKDFGKGQTESSPVQQQIQSVMANNYIPHAPFTNLDIVNPFVSGLSTALSTPIPTPVASSSTSNTSVQTTTTSSNVDRTRPGFGSTLFPPPSRASSSNNNAPSSPPPPPVQEQTFWQFISSMF